MKAKNLKSKPYIIPAKSGNVLLVPAGKAVEVPVDADKDYLRKLADNGLIEIIEDTQADNELIEIIEDKPSKKNRANKAYSGK